MTDTPEPWWRPLLRRKEVPTPAPTTRLAVPDAEPALTALARLDATRPPRGLVLVAEADGRLLAAVSLDDGHAVADPRRPTGELLWALLERARGLRRALRGPQPGLARVWPPLAA